jgi:uncharacterized membrane protein
MSGQGDEDRTRVIDRTRVVERGGEQLPPPPPPPPLPPPTPVKPPSDAKSASNLGLIGTSLILVGTIVPFLSIAGLVLTLIALNRLSRAYGSSEIWRNALYGSIMGIVGGVAFTVDLILIPGPFASTALFAVFCVFTAPEYIFFSNAYRELAELSGVNDFNSAIKWYRHGVKIIIIGIIPEVLGELLSYMAGSLTYALGSILTSVGSILIIAGLSITSIVGNAYALAGFSYLSHSA